MADAHSLCARQRPTVEVDRWRPAPLPDDLDLPPTHAPSAGAKGLHHRLLGGEAAGKLRSTAPAVGPLSIGIDPLQEALAVPLGDTPDSAYLNYVDPVYQHLAQRPFVIPAASRIRGTRDSQPMAMMCTPLHIGRISRMIRAVISTLA